MRRQGVAVVAVVLVLLVVAVVLGLREGAVMGTAPMRSRALPASYPVPCLERGRGRLDPCINGIWVNGQDFLAP
jgi:hypothetical protein